MRSLDILMGAGVKKEICNYDVTLPQITLYNAYLTAVHLRVESKHHTVKSTFFSFSGKRYNILYCAEAQDSALVKWSALFLTGKRTMPGTHCAIVNPTQRRETIS